MAEAHKIAKLSELVEDKHLAAKIGEHPVALFLVEGEVYATAGKCPHAGGQLHRGTVCDGKLSCPWHGWSYDLRTGECEESDDISLACYPVRVEDDDVYVIL
ncbi:MAG: Rieske 2Fe-2S domain-containing protein [Pseudomonadota bacterium]|jgi:nitrite reductase (NADH) small subunit|nr:Rieske 2Fe-2S domain-containing protein [Pseudomonadota bacterium]